MVNVKDQAHFSVLDFFHNSGLYSVTSIKISSMFYK